MAVYGYGFRLPSEAYSPSPDYALEYVSLREAEKEYVRLRGIVQKRKQRLQTEGFSFPSLELPKLTSLKAGGETNKRLLFRGLASARAFIEGETTVKEIKANRAKRRQVYEEFFGESQDLPDRLIGEFFAAAEAIYGKIIPPSDEIVKAFELVEKTGIDVDWALAHINEVIENREDILVEFEEWKNSHEGSSDFFGGEW